VKIGMLSSASITAAVAEGLAVHPHGPVVLDPVMIAKSGDALLRPDARQALIERVLPLADVVTPNLPEAGALAGMEVSAEKDMEEAARRIQAMGARTVLVKGGHLTDSATDILWDGTRLTRFEARRVGTASLHGTGCTLSSAIAAGLARGRALEDAIHEAKAYVTAAIREGFAAGHGVGVLRHFVERW
jgi:hydroxymethylpyrimidine/phosphomethylpyrimidine kinase